MAKHALYGYGSRAHGARPFCGHMPSEALLPGHGNHGRCAHASGRGCLPCDQADLFGNWRMMPLLSKSAKARMCRWMAS